MEEKQIENYDLVNLGNQVGVQKTTEFFVSRALNAIFDGVKSTYASAQVLLGDAFTRYLENATKRYNQVKTLATGYENRTIIGSNNLYVSIGVGYREKRIDTYTVDNILKINNNILISGTGGVGKSMLMRYLFLNTANRGEYVPVLLELRKISTQALGKISILDLIYSCLNDFDIKLPKDQFEFSLRLGKYLFLMDGFDEVKESLASETAEAIQKFCAKYPNNPCIVTSRPRNQMSLFETFTTLESLPLTKSQAITLAKKIWVEDDKTREFCKQLDNELFKKHKDFAENPLLLSMMFLTFMRNNSIPNHLAEFYSKAYDALYSAHDSHNKGYYRREFRCCDLDEANFKQILSRFCFQSYFNEKYEFTKEEVLDYLQKSLDKLEIFNIKPNDYLEDLRKAICIIIKDGDIYRFSHRSFQTYFAACYTSNILTDDQQKQLFDKLLSGSKSYNENVDYYDLLSQIEPRRFLVNALEKNLKKIHDEFIELDDVYNHLIPKIYRSIEYEKIKHDNSVKITAFFLSHEFRLFYYNYIELTNRYLMNRQTIMIKNEDYNFISKVLWKLDLTINYASYITFRELNLTDQLTESEKKQFYTTLARRLGYDGFLDAIADWLKQLEKSREDLQSNDFIENL